MRQRYELTAAGASSLLRGPFAVVAPMIMVSCATGVLAILDALTLALGWPAIEKVFAGLLGAGPVRRPGVTTCVPDRSMR